MMIDICAVGMTLPRRIDPRRWPRRTAFEWAYFAKRVTTD